MKKILTHIILPLVLCFAAIFLAVAQEIAPQAASGRENLPPEARANETHTPKSRASIAFWNLENFFDYFDDATSSSDSDFSSFGSRHWTKKRFTAKCNLIGKTLLWMGMPDVVGVAEVENGFVLNRLVNSAVLRKMDYSYVHYDSPDRRGIDVALLYRRSRLRILSSRAVHILSDEGDVMPTRDILYVEAEFIGGGGKAPGAENAWLLEEEKASGEKTLKIHLLVNHHPSKYSGSKASEHSRELAMQALKDVCDSICSVSNAPIVAMGDFNDSPSGEQFKIMEGVLENLAAPLSARGEGSIRFNGRWELIDHFLVDFSKSSEFQSAKDSSLAPLKSPQSMPPTPQMQVLQPPFLMTRDRTHTGFKPQRTYTGPRYTAGVSDHLPILLLLP